MPGRNLGLSVPPGDYDEEEYEAIIKQYRDYDDTKPKVVETAKPSAEVPVLKVPEEKPKLKVPRAFDESYYEKHIEKAYEEHNHDKKYILYWEQLGRYEAAFAAARNSSAPAMESWSIRPQVHNPAARANHTAAVGE